MDNLEQLQSSTRLSINQGLFHNRTTRERTTRTDCTSVIEWACHQLGEHDIARKISKMTQDGIELAKYLNSIGWLSGALTLPPDNGQFT